MPTIPPAFTAACYVAVLCLMIWRRTKAVWAWIIVLSSVLGSVYLFRMDGLYAKHQLSNYAYDVRLYKFDLLQWWCELLATGLLTFGTKMLRAASSACGYVFTSIIIHLLMRWGYALSYVPGWYPDHTLEFIGDVTNLIMIGAIAVVIWTGRYCAED